MLPCVPNIQRKTSKFTSTVISMVFFPIDFEFSHSTFLSATSASSQQLFLVYVRLSRMILKTIRIPYDCVCVLLSSWTCRIHWERNIQTERKKNHTDSTFSLYLYFKSNGNWFAISCVCVLSVVSFLIRSIAYKILVHLQNVCMCVCLHWSLCVYVI